MGTSIGINISLSCSHFLPDSTVTFKWDVFVGTIYVSRSDAPECSAKEDVSWLL